jgi:glycerol-1-phosphate dehydrogenase [NAD(P)+]
MKFENPYAIFGREFACQCGRTHRVAPREIVYSSDATARTPEVCARAAQGRRVAVVMDARTREVAGRDVCAALAGAGWTVQDLVVPDPAPGHSPVCDDTTRDWLDARMAAVDLAVSVGGGVMTDLTRWVTFARKTPFVSVATAASMNGYASASIAGTVKGVKCLIYAHAPHAVLADPRVIRDAPYELTASGLGDVLAKPVSTADWRFNHKVFADYYCPVSVGIVAEIEPLYIDRPEDIRARAPQGMEALFQACLLTGVAMNIADTSAPASGGEHMISHVLDMMCAVYGGEHDMHGRQVGIGTVLAAELYRRVLEVESPSFVEPARRTDAAFWGPLAEEVEPHYQGKVERLRLAAERLAAGGAWDDVRRTLRPMLRRPETLRDCLRRAGAAHRAEDIRCTPERLKQALLHGHEIRSRITILDLARLVGVMPAAADEIIEAWAR